MDYWGVWYNKKVFKKYNLSVPKTWSEFMNINKVLKANGVTPMAESVQGRWPAFIIFEEMVARQDPDLYVKLCEGKVKYSDPRVKKAFEVWADLIKKGYFTDASVSLFSDAPRLFNTGKIAMVPIGTWYYSQLKNGGVPEDSIGIFIMPPVNPDAGKVVIMEAGPILMAQNAPHREAAKKIVDWWMGPKGNAYFAKMLDTYPSNLKADSSYLPEVKKDLLKTIVNEHYRILNRYWEATPTPISEAAVDEFAKFMLHPDTLDEVLAKLDKIADNYWSKNK